MDRRLHYTNIKAGMQAPSAANQQPWEFYVVTDKDKIDLMSLGFITCGGVLGRMESCAFLIAHVKLTYLYYAHGYGLQA